MYPPPLLIQKTATSDGTLPTQLPAVPGSLALQLTHADQVVGVFAHSFSGGE